MASTQRDPCNFMFNEEEETLIKKHMEEQNSRLIDMNENLATDKIRVPSQNYALISIVSSTQTTQKSNKTCVKIRGVFDTIEDANQHAARIVQVDPTFDIMVVSMYEWLMIPPEMDKLNDQKYMDDDLNGLLSEYRKTQERAHIEFDVHKEGLKQNTHSLLIETEKNESVV
jgi:hypothetical protein